MRLLLHAAVRGTEVRWTALISDSAFGFLQYGNLQHSLSTFRQHHIGPSERDPSSVAVGPACRRTCRQRGVSCCARCRSRRTALPARTPVRSGTGWRRWKLNPTRLGLLRDAPAQPRSRSPIPVQRR